MMTDFNLNLLYHSFIHFFFLVFQEFLTIFPRKFPIPILLFISNGIILPSPSLFNITKSFNSGCIEKNIYSHISKLNRSSQTIKIDH